MERKKKIVRPRTRINKIIRVKSKKKKKNTGSSKGSNLVFFGRDGASAATFGTIFTLGEFRG